MKTRRILAWIAIGLIIAMILLTLVLAFLGSPLFQASLYCTLVVPIVIYSGMLIYKNASHRKELPFESDEEDSENDN